MKHVAPRPAAAPLRADQGLIIEFFGVPGAGKTTLATVLAERLGDAGIPARLHSTPDSGLRTRLRSLLGKSWSLAVAMASARERLSQTRALLDILPQADRDQDLRLWQYLIHLSGLYARARRRRQILILDQGSLQAVYSLAVRSSARSDEALDRAVGAVPRPDLLMALAPSHEIVAERLRQRRRRGRLRSALIEGDGGLAASIGLVEQIRTRAEHQGWEVNVPRPNLSGDDLASEIVARLIRPGAARAASGLPEAQQARAGAGTGGSFVPDGGAP
ncbi:MAG TPA: hypothetical protein VFZ01_18940, partial [Geminicoccaceae bacterium]